jgi:hypothetical protein
MILNIFTDDLSTFRAFPKFPESKLLAITTVDPSKVNTFCYGWSCTRMDSYFFFSSYLKLTGDCCYMLGSLIMDLDFDWIGAGNNREDDLMWRNLSRLSYEGSIELLIGYLPLMKVETL